MLSLGLFIVDLLTVLKLDYAVILAEITDVQFQIWKSNYWRRKNMERHNWWLILLAWTMRHAITVQNTNGLGANANANF